VPSTTQSYNVTSITDTGVGRLTVTIATDFSSGSYCVMVTPGYNTTTTCISAKAKGDTYAAGSIELNMTSAASALIDPDQWEFSMFGDQ